MNDWDVIVIGGGSAGMMAAGCAAARGRRVLLLEKNGELGEKLKITGGGRCNITNAEFNEQILLKNYGKAASFLFSPFSQFGVQETFDFFASRGLSLVVQEGKRAFPESERALDVFRVLERFLRESGVTIETNARVSLIQGQNRAIRSVSVGKQVYTAQAVIIASGGTSHPETGSTGDGFMWLRELGHTVHTPRPTIVPLEIAERSIRSLAGVTIPEAKLTFYLNGKKQFAKKGALMFTHFGISGPVVLNSSGKVGDLLHAGSVTALVDFFPDGDERVLEDRIIALFDENKNKALKNIINLLCHQQILSCMTGVSGEKKAHSVTKEERKSMVRTLKGLPMTVTRLMGLDRAVVVDGGVDIREVHSRTMCSTLYDNLFIVGDLLHINRPTGGYSLQLCWTSGWVAGNSA